MGIRFRGLLLVAIGLICLYIVFTKIVSLALFITLIVVGISLNLLGVVFLLRHLKEPR